MSAAQLYIVMKDHGQKKPLEKMMLNRVRLISSRAREEGFELNRVLPSDDIKPVNIILLDKLDTGVKSALKKGLDSLKMVSVDYHLEMKEGVGKLFKF